MSPRAGRPCRVGRSGAVARERCPDRRPRSFDTLLLRHAAHAAWRSANRRSRRSRPRTAAGRCPCAVRPGGRAARGLPHRRHRQPPRARRRTSPDLPADAVPARGLARARRRRETLVEHAPTAGCGARSFPTARFGRCCSSTAGGCGARHRRGRAACALPLVLETRRSSPPSSFGRLDGRVRHATRPVCLTSAYRRAQRAVGEAAFAIDPLSSSGVHSRSSRRSPPRWRSTRCSTASSTATPSGTAPTSAPRQRPTRRSPRAPTPTALAGRAFWARSRPQVPLTAAPRNSRAHSNLLAHPVWLARERRSLGAVHRRRPRGAPAALTDASLARPVAFLGGLELAPLVAAATAAPTLEAAIAGWRAGGVAAPTAQAVARWLAEHGVIAGRDP